MDTRRRFADDGTQLRDLCLGELLRLAGTVLLRAVLSLIDQAG